jgi:hypothetical protein
MSGSVELVEAGASDQRRRYLAYSEVAVTPRDRPVVAGILRADTVADLAPDVRVDTLLPHDALLVLERTEPDLVLVESGALTAGHPWAGAGDPSVADVARRLLRVLDMARVLGRPTVLWWNEPRHATSGLIPFESRFDLVLSLNQAPGEGATAWSQGVQLARFSPLGAGPDRSARPVAHARWDHMRTRAVRSFAEAAFRDLADDELDLWIDAEAIADVRRFPEWLAGRGVRRVAAPDLPEHYRTQALFIAEPPIGSRATSQISTNTLRQLASGARVVSGPNDVLAASLGEWIEWAPDPLHLRDAIRSGAERGPRTTGEIRRLLRSLFLGHDTTLAVRSLCRLAAVDGATPRRDLCAVARLDAEHRPEAFLDDLVSQRYRPSEALIAADDPADASIAMRELEPLGIPARSLQPPRTGCDTAGWAVSHTTADWLWVWEPGRARDPAYLLDSLVAGLISGASVVGTAAGSRDGFGDGMLIEDPVVSRAAAARFPGTGSGWTRSWMDRGATFYGIGADTTAP